VTRLLEQGRKMTVFCNHKKMRLKNYDYSRPGAYFGTICVQGKLSLLGEIKNEEIALSDFGKLTKKFWQKICKELPV